MAPPGGGTFNIFQSISDFSKHIRLLITLLYIVDERFIFGPTRVALPPVWYTVYGMVYGGAIYAIYQVYDTIPLIRTTYHTIRTIDLQRIITL